MPTDPRHVGELLAHASADGEILGELAERSPALGHELIGWLRDDEDDICYPERCRARIYTRLATLRTEDGEALADACRTRGAPKPQEGCVCASGPAGSQRLIASSNSAALTGLGM